ncbi:MAG: MBL fold metallo-hydrolase [Planctomycetes bacterium]|nr:MBL fold metallo-hydrolase [Planctomycetota bacterium]
MYLERIYDEDLSQAAWLIGCQATGEALLIDPQRDVCRYLDAAENAGLKISAITETHIHADFLSGTAELATATNAVCYLSGHGGADWSYKWPSNSNVNVDVTYVCEGDTFHIGNLKVTVVHTPGHTPEHICFLVHDKNTEEPIGYATGDFVFVGDLGRPDLLETAAGVEGVMVASAQQLHTTCERFLDMEDFVQIWPAHGAGSACGKALGAVPQSTAGYEKRTSPPLQLVGDEPKFVDFMLTGQPEPPLYFARMKRMNRDGMPILGGLPQPSQITSPEILKQKSESCTVIDTRDWEHVRDGHLPGSIWSKATNDFHRFAGSFVDDFEEIVFITTKENLDRAIRNAIRIGLDRIIGWAEPSMLEGMDGLVQLPEIAADELLARTDQAMLDVRRLQEYQDGAIPGALNIAHTRLFDRLDTIDRSTAWVIHCQGGSRSAAACMALKRKGYNVTNLAGGYKGWCEATKTCVSTT